MKFDTFLLDISYRLKDKTEIVFSVGNMPALGLSASIFPIEGIAQSVAEVLGGAVILKLLNTDRLVTFGPWIYMSDMGTGNFILGGHPVYMLLNLLLVDVYRFYGMDLFAKTFNNTAKQIDVQAALEVSAGTGLLAARGVRNFGFAGIYSSDEIYSGLWLVIQNEILEYVKRLIQGVEFKVNSGVIEDCAVNGDYLGHETTLGNYSDLLWKSPLFNYKLYSQVAGGRMKVLDTAKEIARTKIASHRYRLDDDRMNELERIWAEALKRFG